MKLNSKIKLLFALLAFALTMQSCYTEVVLPKHAVKKTKVDENLKVNFTYTVIDTFDFAWMPDEGYYYEFRYENKGIKEYRIADFLNMLYAKGYNIAGAWYRPATNDCREQPGIRTWVEPKNGMEPANTLSPMFIVLLSDVDDSIIEHNFYPVMNKPFIHCPYNVWEFWIE